MPNFIRPVENFVGLSPFSRTFKERLENMAELVYRWRDNEVPMVKILKKRWEEDDPRRQLKRLIIAAPNEQFAPNRWQYVAYTPSWNQSEFRWVKNAADPHWLFNAAENENTTTLVRGTVPVGTIGGVTVTCLPIAVHRLVWARPLKEMTVTPLHPEIVNPIWEFSEPNDFTVTCVP